MTGAHRMLHAGYRANRIFFIFFFELRRKVPERADAGAAVSASRAQKK